MSITQIPIPGSSGVMPTGAMQFQDDWPGLFIRGDDALQISSYIRFLQKRLTGDKDPRTIVCLIELGKIADMIEKDVIVRRESP